MNLRIIALVFQFLINCWPKSNIMRLVQQPRIVGHVEMNIHQFMNLEINLNVQISTFPSNEYYFNFEQILQRNNDVLNAC